MFGKLPRSPSLPLLLLGIESRWGLGDDSRDQSLPRKHRERRCEAMEGRRTRRRVEMERKSLSNYGRWPRSDAQFSRLLARVRWPVVSAALRLRRSLAAPQRPSSRARDRQSATVDAANVASRASDWVGSGAPYWGQDVRT